MRFFLIAGLLVFLLVPVPVQAKIEKSIYVSVWAEYLPGWVWQQFYDETKIKAIPKFYARRNIGSEQQMLQRAGHSDLLLMCYDHGRMLNLHEKLQPIDYARLKNYHNLQLSELTEKFREKFDFCLPFDWTLLGLVVNSRLVNPAKLLNFSALWDADIAPRVFLPEEPRVLGSVALLAAGASSNCNDLKRIKTAKSKMEELLPVVDGVSNYGMVDAFTRGSTAVGVIWGNMAIDSILAAQPHIKYVLPEGKPTLMVECWVIPKQAGNIDGVYAFMDFLMRPDVAQRLVNEVGYPTINNKTQLPAATKNNLLYNPPLNLLREAQLQDYVPVIDEKFKDLSY